MIFDDLERCHIPVNDVLGYINQFVEHHGHKAIIIANEDEIIEREKDNEQLSTQFKKIKEKLIGKTFQVLPDINDSLNDFISKIADDKVKTFINKNRALIIEIYEDSTYENLRQLKQALWDFERFMIEMPAKAWEKKPLLQHILKLFLTYSFEIKSGYILPNEIGQIKESYFTDYALKKENRENEISKFDKLRAKYRSIMFHETVLDVNCWEDIFVKGIINRESIEQSILKSSYFQDETTPTWVKLWHFMDLSDEEYDEILRDVEEKYYDMRYEEIGEVKHITGILLFLSGEVKLYKKTKDDILTFAKSYIDYLKDHNKLNLEPKVHFTPMDRTSWGGLGFYGKDLPEFKEFIDYIDNKTSDARVEKMPDAGKRLMEIMKSDIMLFARKVTLSESPDQEYYDIPIFKHIPPTDFVESFLKLNSDDKRIVAYAIKNRYQFVDINKSLIEELEWLKNIHSLLSEKKQVSSGKLSGYTLQFVIIDDIEKAITSLESILSENKGD